LPEPAVVAVAAEELAAPDVPEVAADDDELDELDELDFDELEQAAPTTLRMSSGTARLRAFVGRIMGGNLLVARGRDVTSPLLFDADSWLAAT